LHPARRFNLLIAEDNLPDVLIVREAISSENLPFEVFTASDGQQALDFIARAERDGGDPSPDLLLLDLNLPRFDGFEVLRRLRASVRFANLPVLVMTSSNSPTDRSRVASLGARYFQKPPSYTEFLKIGEMLRQVIQSPDL
jgi:CheY-like chemotaxis protein